MSTDRKAPMDHHSAAVRNHLPGALAALATISLILPGCGSDDSGGSGQSGGSGSSAIVAEANKTIAQYRAKPKFTPPGPPIDGAKLRGKKILVVNMDQVAQQLVTIVKGIKQASSAAGLGASFFDAKGTVSQIQAGISRGISQKVDAIILNGADPSLVPNSVKQAKAAGIPVVADSLGQNVKNPDVFGLSSPDYELIGKLMAYGGIVETDGKLRANVIKFTNPAVPDATSGINSVLKRCGSSCSISKTINIDPPDWPTKVAPSTVALIRADPQLNLIFAVVDDTLGLFTATGVRQAASKNVKVVAAQGSGGAPLSVVKQGEAFVADPGQSASWIGWGAVDQAMRGMTKMKAVKEITPPRYLDAESLKNVDVNDEAAMYGDAYVGGFRKLWGLTGP